VVKISGSKIFIILKMSVFKSTSLNLKAKKPKRGQSHWLRRAAACHEDETSPSSNTVRAGEPDEPEGGRLAGG
jgi:hypothetical protein